MRKTMILDFNDSQTKDGLWEKIEEERGKIPRARFIKDLLEKTLFNE